MGVGILVCTDDVRGVGTSGRGNTGENALLNPTAASAMRATRVALAFAAIIIAQQILFSRSAWASGIGHWACSFAACLFPAALVSRQDLTGLSEKNTDFDRIFKDFSITKVILKRSLYLRTRRCIALLNFSATVQWLNGITFGFFGALG